MTVDVSAAPVWRTLRTDGWSPASGRRDWYASMTGRADSGFFKHRYEKQNEVQRACGARRRRHGRAPRGRVPCDTNITALRAESSSRPESTHHRTQVKPQLRGTKDDEHRVGGRKPSFGHHDGFPGLQIQDGDAYSLNFQGTPYRGKECWGHPAMCINQVCIQRCVQKKWQWWSRTYDTHVMYKTASLNMERSSKLPFQLSREWKKKNARMSGT